MAATVSPASSSTAASSAFGPVRQIDAGLLNVGYVDSGPADGPAVVTARAKCPRTMSLGRIAEAFVSLSGYRPGLSAL
jgi:hypothetical protein